ncbi:MAG: hypothetical protein V7L28_36360 [Nostoc sp.]
MTLAILCHRMIRSDGNLGGYRSDFSREVLKPPKSVAFSTG